MSQVIVDRQIFENSWLHLEDEAALPSSGDVTVSLARWEADAEALANHAGKLGIRIPNDINIEEITEEVLSKPLLMLDFPIIDTNKRGYHPNGKAYSQARALRQHREYKGEIRAHGEEVIGDVLGYMERCGINAFELREGEDLGDALARFSEFSLAYQGAASGPQPIFLRRRNASA